MISSLQPQVLLQRTSLNLFKIDYKEEMLEHPFHCSALYKNANDFISFGIKCNFFVITCVQYAKNGLSCCIKHITALPLSPLHCCLHFTFKC